MPKLADAMLTDQQIRRMPNPPVRVEKSDKNSGLYLIVQPSGAKSWAIRYRVERDGKLVQTRTTLGHYPGLGLADARTKARALREAADKRAAEIAATVPALAAPDAPVALPAPVVNSVSRIWGEYSDKFLTTKQPGTAARYRREFDKNILPVWGSRAVAEISKADVKTIVNDAEARGPEARNNILVALKSFFGWCSDADQDYVEASPVFTFTIRQQDSRDRTLEGRRGRRVLERLRQARTDLWADVPAFASDRRTPRRSRRNAMVGDQWQRVDDTGRAYQEQSALRRVSDREGSRRSGDDAAHGCLAVRVHDLGRYLLNGLQQG